MLPLLYLLLVTKMKRKDLIDTKALDIKALQEKAGKLRTEIADLILDKNMNSLKDLKVIAKKRKDLAQTLTVLRQKQLLEMLEIGKEKSQ